MSGGSPGRTALRRAPLLALALALAVGCAGRRGATTSLPDPPSTSQADPALPRDEGAPASRPPGGEEDADWQPEPLAEPDAEADPERDAARERILAAARALLGTRFRGDCSGYVLRAFHTAGVGVRLGPGVSRSESLYRASRPIETPRPGALAFFHDSYDRDRDRRLDDRFTHVALVERVEGTTVFLLHRSRKGIERARMDLSRADDPAANDRLRSRRRGDPRGTRYLTGELFAAFGELLEGEFTQMLQAGRVAETGARHPATR